MALLEVKDIHTYYGNIEALKGITVEVEEGECVTLIGSNGAGKSTTLRSISGLTPPRQGSIRFNDREITETPPQDIVSMGVAQSPEGRHVFSRMTVHENLLLGAYLRRDQSEITSDLDRVYELFPRLKERERQKGGTMSGGEQQMLAIGRALMARPTLLLLDEPSMGIAPDPRRAHLRDDRRDQPPGHDDPARGAERELRARRVGPRLRARDRQGGSARQVGRPAREPRSPASVPGGVMQTFLAVIGPEALWLTFVWLASAIIASLFSSLKGYGEKTGLVTGTVLTLLGAFIWAVWPAQEVSRWKIHAGLGSTEKAVLGIVVAIIVIAGIFVVVSIDAGGGGKIGLAAGGDHGGRDRRRRSSRPSRSRVRRAARRWPSCAPSSRRAGRRRARSLLAQRLLEVGPPELVAELLEARRHGALAGRDDRGHLAVERLDRQRRHRARTPAGAARGRASSTAPCS